MQKLKKSLLTILLAGNALLSKDAFSQTSYVEQENGLAKDAVISRYFKFEYEDESSDYTYWLKSRISVQRYLHYKKWPHPLEDKSNFLKYSTPTDIEIKSIANHISNIRKNWTDYKDDWTKEEKAQALLDFVHKHIYEEDIDAYIRTPIETIVEGAGDCEDLSVLGYSLMKSAGIDVVYLFVEGDVSNYVFLGVNGNFYGTYVEHNGKKYFVAETTGTEWPDEPVEWKIGECPEEYKEKDMEIIAE